LFGENIQLLGELLLNALDDLFCESKKCYYGLDVLISSNGC